MGGVGEGLPFNGVCYKDHYEEEVFDMEEKARSEDVVVDHRGL